MGTSNKRKNYFIKRGFQTKLTIITLLLVVIVANLVGGIIYGVLTGNDLTQYFSKIFKVSTANLLLPTILMAELISIFIVAIIGVFVSHSMAGPVYRFEKVLKTLCEGEMDCSFKLRSSDEFHELEEHINDLIELLNQKIGKVKHIVVDIEKLSKTGNKKELQEKIVELNKALEYFKINEDELNNENC